MVVGTGLFDNVLSDYLWARAVLLIGEDLLSPITYAPKSLVLILC